MFSQLRETALRYPAIDNHAHNVLKEESKSSIPFHHLAGEARGDAARDTVHTLAAMRAATQLASLFSCEPTWEAVEAHRNGLSYEDLCRRCFESAGIQILLLDDLMTGIEETCLPTPSHANYTKHPPKRVIRIESVAEKLFSLPNLAELFHQDLSPDHARHTTHIPFSAFSYFNSQFAAEILGYCRDENVVAFKSVACYRTGLDIGVSESNEADDRNSSAEFYTAMHNYLNSNPKKIRLAYKHLIDRLVRITLRLAGVAGKPVQFHTGLGDSDIRVTKSSPSHLQPLIEAFTGTKFVILHSSYPFTREAGYLASVYHNVYLDFGEIFPLVSADGQRQVIREMLELCPTNKLLWSTDGHYWPETFYLGAHQSRQALYKVLSDTINRGDLTEAQAVEIVQRVLFRNSNELYRLGLQEEPPQAPVSRPTSTPTHPLDKLPDSVKNIRIQWVDFLNTVRFRVIPLSRFRKLLSSDSRGGITLTKAAFFLSQGDAPTEGFSATGEWLYVPDLSSLRVCGYAKGYASVLGYFEEKSGQTSELCPRSLLRGITKKAARQHIKFLTGFETEFILLPPEGPEHRNKSEWCCSQAIRSGSRELAILEAITDALDHADVEVECWHSESAPGQYEVVTGPLPPLEAVDALITVRETVYNCASKFGWRATMAPKVDNNAAGSGAHVHVSFKSTKKHDNVVDPTTKLTKAESSFLQGILTNLPSICAFSLPLDASYSRMVDGAWAGGTWVSWGLENKECPIRLVGSPSKWHLELKALDGTANPYLAVAALLASGLEGIKRELHLAIKDCRVPAASMTDEERAAHGVDTRMPNSAEAAQNHLRTNAFLTEEMGEGLVKAFQGVNNHLSQAVSGVDLIHRY